MKTEIRAFDETTLGDAKKVVSEMFSPAVCPLLDKMLANPLRKKLGVSSAGEIAYQDGKPVAFQGALLRRLFIGQQPIIGIVGSSLCSKPETSPVLLMHLMKATIKPRGGSKLFFSNTANPTSMKMNRLLGVKGAGPETCAKIRFDLTWVPPFFKLLCPRPNSTQIKSIDAKTFNSFWERYLEDNRGGVCSRTAEELDWMFGEGLSSGKTVAFGEFKNDELIGYVVIHSTHNSRRWMVFDWIALHDDKSVLKRLLVSAVRFVRRETKAVLFEMIGFSDAADKIASLVIPFRRNARNNSYLWSFNDKETSIPTESWFFGPYDGDRCMI